jgi:hypothetical protein
MIIPLLPRQVIRHESTSLISIAYTSCQYIKYRRAGKPGFLYDLMPGYIWITIQPVENSSVNAKVWWSPLWNFGTCSAHLRECSRDRRVRHCLLPEHLYQLLVNGFGREAFVVQEADCILLRRFCLVLCSRPFDVSTWEWLFSSCSSRNLENSEMLTLLYSGKEFHGWSQFLAHS